MRSLYIFWLLVVIVVSRNRASSTLSNHEEAAAPSSHAGSFQVQQLPAEIVGGNMLRGDGRKLQSDTMAPAAPVRLRRLRWAFLPANKQHDGEGGSDVFAVVFDYILLSMLVLSLCWLVLLMIKECYVKCKTWRANNRAREASDGEVHDAHADNDDDSTIADSLHSVTSEVNREVKGPVIVVTTGTSGNMEEP